VRTDDPLDRSQIDLLLSLDDGVGEALAEIVDEYLIMSLQGRAELLRELGDGDSDALARTAHTLKGASSNLGAIGLVDVCARLEAGATGDDLDGATALIEQFEMEFVRVRTALLSVTVRR